MLKWTPYVMIRICLSFIGGILLGIYWPDSIHESYAVGLLVVLIILFVVAYLFLHDRDAIRATTGVLGLLALFLTGYLHLLNRTDSRNPDHLLFANDSIQYYEAIVRSAPESKARSWKVEVEVVRVKSRVWIPKQGKVLLYVSKKSVDKIPWLYGDRLLIRGSPNELNPPANPHEFNFKRFLGFKNIYHQQFIEYRQTYLLPYREKKGLLYYSSMTRAWATEKFLQHVQGEKQQAIAMALVLGVTEGIDTDLQNAYAASGAMHVLAVSGLHVGILYSIITALLLPLKRFAWSRWVVFAISLTCLWSFAFVTGLSPSVLRAVTMFSFVALARPLGWKTNIYNTLAGSAFVLLYYNPYLIMSVGFQLSYLAVIGIVYLQRPLYQMWEIHHGLGDWVWKISCVSVAAQASTFALGMLYFHQFPVYFLVSNLFVIPLATGILVGGIVLLITSWVNSLASLVGYLLTSLIWLINKIVVVVESWPNSIIEGIYITTFQCWLIMGILLCLVFLFEFKKIQWLYGSLVIALMLMFTQWQHYTRAVDQSHFVVYSINGHQAMEWVTHGKSYLKADSSLIQDPERIRFHIRPNRLYHGVRNVYPPASFYFPLQEGMAVIRWRNYWLLHIDRETMLPESVKIDYLIVSRNSFKSEWLSKLSQVQAIVLDGTNSRGYIRRLKEDAGKRNIAVHAVTEDRAFVLL
jgi:competence protein ComEC